MLLQMIARCLQLEAIAGAAFVLVLSLASSPVGAQQPAEVQLPFRPGDFAVQIDRFNSPAGVAVSRDGEVFVADTLGGRIVVLGRDGTDRRIIGAGVLRRPSAVLIDDAQPQCVWVSDGDRLMRFTLSGEVHGSAIGGPEVFHRMAGMDVHGGEIFVADSGRNTVSRITRSGRVIASFGGFGSGPGQLNHPQDVAVDDDGFVYVADSDNNRIQKFDIDGRWIGSWGQWGPFPGLLDRPSGIVARDGRIFVADQQNHRVQVFTPDGALVYCWGLHALLPREGDGKLHYPADLAIDPAGQFMVVCEPFENRIQVFDVAASHVTEAQLNVPPQPMAQQTHFGRYLDVDGNLLAVGEPETHTVYIFRVDRQVPVIINQFGMQGVEAGRFSRIGPIHIDAQRKRLWIADQGSRLVQCYSIEDLDSTGPLRMQPFASRFVRAVDLGKLLDDARGPVDPIAIDVDRAGRLYVLDDQRQAVVVFDPDSRSARVLHVALPPANDLLIDDSAGMLWILTSRPPQELLGFDLSTSRIVDRVDLAGQVSRAVSIARDDDGDWLITDEASGEIHVFRDGARAVFAGHGSHVGALWQPGQLRIADDGRIFVVDYGNHRAQIFSTDGMWLVSFGIGRARTADDDGPEDDQ